MQFITLQDLRGYIKDNILADMLQLSYTIITNSGSSILDEIENISISKVKAFTNNYYDVDFELTKISLNRDSLLIAMVIDIMLYELNNRLTPSQIPENRKLRYQATIKDLQEIMNRKMLTNWAIKQLGSEPTTMFRSGSSFPFSMYY